MIINCVSDYYEKIYVIQQIDDLHIRVYNVDDTVGFYLIMVFTMSNGLKENIMAFMVRVDHNVFAHFNDYVILANNYYYYY